MLCLKSCPRCRGDLYFGWESEAGCIQCGYELRPPEQTALLAKLQWPRRRPVPATGA